MNESKNETVFKAGDDFIDFFKEGVPVQLAGQILNAMVRSPETTFKILTHKPELIEEVLSKLGMKSFPKNVWLGVVVSKNEDKYRIDILRKIQAELKFVACTPLLEDLGYIEFKGIGWVISSGDSVKPLDVEWIERLDEITKSQGVPHYFNEYGCPENNPIFKDCPSELNPYEFVALVDDVGRGGSMINDRYIKEVPPNFPFARFKGVVYGRQR